MVSSAPIAAAAFPRDFDFQAEADAARDAVPELDRDYGGEATIETYTVLHHRDGTPRAGVVVARTPAGARTLAHVPGEDRETIARLTDPDSEPVGARGWVESAEPLALWRFA